MDKVKKNLSGEYRAGKRWLAYDSLKSAGWLGRLRCFSDYSAAADWCKAGSGKNGVFRIRVLAEVLAGLNGVRVPELTSAEREVLNDLVECRPIASYRAAIPLELGLLRQRYFPVLWRSVVEPLSAVRTYYVVSRRGNGAGKPGVTVLGSCLDFGYSIVLFKKAMRRQLFNEDLLLVGSMIEKVNLTARELLPADGAILFYRSAASEPGEEGNWEPEIGQEHDPTVAVVVQTPYFAGYDRQLGRINFFDGGLRRVAPGGEWLRLDLEYFDFDCNEIFDGQSVL